MRILILSPRALRTRYVFQLLLLGDPGGITRHHQLAHTAQQSESPLSEIGSLLGAAHQRAGWYCFLLRTHK